MQLDMLPDCTLQLLCCPRSQAGALHVPAAHRSGARRSFCSRLCCWCSILQLLQCISPSVLSCSCVQVGPKRVYFMDEISTGACRVYASLSAYLTKCESREHTLLCLPCTPARLCRVTGLGMADQKCAWLCGSCCRA